MDEGKCKAILSASAWTRRKGSLKRGGSSPQLFVESTVSPWELLDYCRTNGIVLQAFAATGTIASRVAGRSYHHRRIAQRPRPAHAR